MVLLDLGWVVFSGLAAWLVTWRVRQYALTHSMLDVPNERSSHVHPTPRGGGLGIVVALELTLLLFWLRSNIDLRSALALGLGAGAIAFVGYLDDRRGLPALLRLCVHHLAAILAVWLLTGQPSTQEFFGGMPNSLAFVLLVLGIVWSTNLFNFMDGIDGIAASEAMFVSLGAAVLISLRGGPEVWVSVALVAAAANLGFLIWNWPPAKIFMGDVGSGFLGFWLAAFAVALHANGVLSIWTSMILASVFVADATTTLLVRLSRQERVYEAHRSHAYQRLARRWGSHTKVSALVWFINIVFVFPVAYVSAIRETFAPWLAAGWIFVLALACLSQGAGARST